MDQIHNPERLEGETQQEYRARQRMSKRVALRGKLLVSSQTPKTYSAPKSKVARRFAKAAIGARQVKKLVRQHRAAAKFAAAEQEAERAGAVAHDYSGSV